MLLLFLCGIVVFLFIFLILKLVPEKFLINAREGVCLGVNRENESALAVVPVHLPVGPRAHVVLDQLLLAVRPLPELLIHDALVLHKPIAGTAFLLASLIQVPNGHEVTLHDASNFAIVASYLSLRGDLLQARGVCRLTARHVEVALIRDTQGVVAGGTLSGDV